MIQIFIFGDYRLVAKMIETMKVNNSSTSDQMDLTDVSGFRCLVMVLCVIMVNARRKKRITNKLGREILYVYMHKCW